ncbi:MerR family transcriptional regulator [Nocardiopsis coralliicola]
MSARTLRYCEARGLLPGRRAENGCRVYEGGDLRLVEQIRILQAFGFSLEEPRPFAECLRDGHPAGDACPSSPAVYRGKLAELDALIARLGAVRASVAGRLGAAERRRPAPEPLCNLSSAPADRAAGTGTPVDTRPREGTR